MAYSDMVPVLSLVPEPNFYPAMCLSLRESRMWLLVRRRDDSGPGSQILGQLHPAAIGFQDPCAEETRRAELHTLFMTKAFRL